MTDRVSAKVAVSVLSTCCRAVGLGFKHLVFFRFFKNLKTSEVHFSLLGFLFIFFVNLLNKPDLYFHCDF